MISIKLDGKCYSIAQMANDNAQMRFFSLFSEVDEWEGIDFTKIRPLFCVFVGNTVIQKLGQRKISPKELNFNESSSDRFFIEPKSNAEGYRLRNEFWDRGGNLVDLGEGAHLAGCQAPVKKEDLTLDKDLESIIKYELTHMWGDLNVKSRLIKYKENSINIDPLKFLIFPGLLEKMQLEESFFDWSQLKLKPSSFQK